MARKVPGRRRAAHKHTAHVDISLSDDSIFPYSREAANSCRLLAKNVWMAVYQWKSATSFLLAGILLAVAVAPPALRHRHPLAAGGEIEHQHGDAHDTSGETHHHGEKSHKDEAASPSPSSTLAGTQWHLHFYLFGFHVTLPDSVPDQEDPTPKTHTVVGVWQLGEQAFTCQTHRDDLGVHVRLQLADSTPGGGVLMATAAPAPAPVSFSPLCDVARRERSGVLLA
jgi:hypothetical protein